MIGRPYAEMAWRYRQAGWAGVIPVGNRARQKSPPVKGYTGWAGADPSGADIQAWINGREGDRNIGLHLPVGIVVPDVDAYNGGADTLKRLTAQVGHPLPPTWSSTPRGDDSDSRHRFYLADLPVGRIWRDHPGGDKSGIDALHVGHRYSVVWPSIHPSGTGYFWYDPDGELWEDVPSPGDLTRLDAAWIEVLSKPGEPLPGEAADDAATQAALGLMRDGRPCRVVTRRLHAELARIRGARDRATAGGLHNPGQLYALAALGMEGHAGVRKALSEHQAAYVQARMQYRDESEQFAGADWWRMMRGAVGKWAAAGGASDRCDCDRPPVSTTTAENRPETVPDLREPVSTTTVVLEAPGGGDGPSWDGWEDAGPTSGDLVPVDPEEADGGFWASRKILWHIRQSAIAGYASPWATLGVVLASVLAATPPVVQLPNTIGGYGSLNLFVALVAPSGGGKGAAERAARLCVEIDARRSGPMTGFATHALGSGEGLAHMFMRRPKPSKAEPDPQPVQYNTAALVTIAEIDTFGALQDRRGSTLGGQLRQAAMGEQLGFFYVDKEKRMPVPEHAYRLTLVAGVQPKRAAALLGEADGGTPQRFVWLPAVLAEGELPAEEDMPDRPEPLLWLAPQWPVAQYRDGAVRTVLQLPDEAVERTIALRREHAQGLGDPLDGHANMVRLKVAAALAILDGRAEVSAEDWALSGVVMDRSTATRQRMLDEIAADRRERNAAEAQAEAARKIIVDDQVEQKARGQAATMVRNKLAKATDPDGWVPWSVLNRSAGKKYRDVLEDVVNGMVSSGVIEAHETQHRAGTGMAYRLRRTGG